MPQGPKARDLPGAPNDPLYSLDINKHGRVSHFMAFDCRYGPESQAQIDWHVKNGTPGAETWEVGVPCRVHGRQGADDE